METINLDLAERLYNWAEVVLWSSIALVLLVYACRRTGAKRRLLAIASAAFAAFGFSDVVEVGSGAWWDPPWLLALKAGCLMTLLLVLRSWQRRFGKATLPAPEQT